MRPRYSNQREQLIDELERLWTNNIRSAQRRLLDEIRNDYLPRLDRSGGQIRLTQSNFESLSRLDAIWSEFRQTEIVRLVQYFIRRARQLFGLDSKYLDGVTGPEFGDRIGNVEQTVFTSLGYDARNNRVIANGPLDRIFSDVRPIEEIKREVSNAIQAETDVDVAIPAIESRVIGIGKRSGSLESFLSESMPQPFQTFDRKTMLSASTEFGLDYFRYSGGLIRDSRPFCIERNTKVFTRTEVERFGTAADEYGGYTNKAAGEWAGKCPRVGYNPFRDLGGCNCRHQLDPISRELALRLRPELREQSNT